LRSFYYKLIICFILNLCISFSSINNYGHSSLNIRGIASSGNETINLADLDEKKLKFLLLRRKTSRKKLLTLVKGLDSFWDKTSYYIKKVKKQRNRISAQKAIDIVENIIYEYPGKVDSLLEYKENLHREIIQNENRKPVVDIKKVLKQQYQYSQYEEYHKKYDKLIHYFEKGYLQGLEYLEGSKIPRTKIRKILESITYKSVRAKGEVFDQFKRQPKQLSFYETWSILAMAYENSNKRVFKSRSFVELGYELCALAEYRYKQALAEFNPNQIHKNEFIPIEAAKFYLAVTIVELYKAQKENDPMIWQSYIDSLKEPQTWIGFVLFVKGARMYSEAISRRNHITFEKIYKRQPDQMALAHFMAQKPISQYVHSMIGMSAGFLFQELSLDIWNDQDFSTLRDSLKKQNSLQAKEMRENAYKSLWERVVTLKGTKDYLYKNTGHLLDLLVTSASMTGAYFGAAKIGSKVKEISPKIKSKALSSLNKMKTKINNLKKLKNTRKSKYVLQGFKVIKKGQKILAPVVTFAQWAVTKGLTLTESKFLRHLGQTVVFLGLIDFWSDIISKNLNEYNFRNATEEVENRLSKNYENIIYNNKYDVLKEDINLLEENYNKYESVLLDDLEFARSRWFHGLESIQYSTYQVKSYYQWISSGAKLSDPFYLENENNWHGEKTLHLFSENLKNKNERYNDEYKSMANNFNSYFCGPSKTQFHYDETFGSFSLTPRNLVDIPLSHLCLSKLNPLTHGSYFRSDSHMNHPIYLYDEIKSWKYRSGFLRKCVRDTFKKVNTRKNVSMISSGAITHDEKCFEDNIKYMQSKLPSFYKELDEVQSKELKKFIDNQYEVLKKVSLKTFNYDSELSDLYSKRMFYSFNLYAQSIDYIITGIDRLLTRLPIVSVKKDNVEDLKEKLLEILSSLKEFKSLYYNGDDLKWSFSNNKNLDDAEYFIELDGLTDQIDITDFDGAEKEKLIILNKFIYLFKESFRKFKIIKENQQSFN
jgi:hypothetical protein